MTTIQSMYKMQIIYLLHDVPIRVVRDFLSNGNQLCSMTDTLTKWKEKWLTGENPESLFRLLNPPCLRLYFFSLLLSVHQAINS
jgi:hypothetical protein